VVVADLARARRRRRQLTTAEAPVDDAARGGARARLLLGAGAALGLLLAALGLRPELAERLPPGAVARVNDTLIRTEELERALAGLAADRRTPLDASERRRVLERLVDDELLFQHGLALGLARRDRLVRAQLVAATLDALAAPAGDVEPDRAAVETFYAAHREYFARAGRMRVRQVVVRADGDDAAPRARAEAAAARLRGGEDFASVRAALADPEPVPLPDALLTPDGLARYVGDTAATAALALPAGGVSAPVRTADGFRVLQALEREDAAIPPLDEIESTVRAEMRRRADEARLRARLATLRAAADVQLAEPAP
jgi:parvulin-like peptidyl-prolyl isomerase